MDNLWICELVMVLIIPILVFFFGYHFDKKGAPKEMNRLFGYRTTRSLQTWETWTFAHAKLGKLWKLTGLIMIPVSAGLFALTYNKGDDVTSVFGIIIMLVQVIALVVTVVFVEKSLKENFDERGERTEASLEAEQKKAQEKAEKKEKSKKK